MANIRLWPRARFVKYDKGGHGFKRWFSVQRFWSGKLVHINCRRWSLVLDFRGNWLADMAHNVK